MSEETAEPENEPRNPPDTFPRAYVEQLRAENAARRKEAEQVTPLREALQVAYLRQGCDGILHDPISWSDDFNDDDGLPDLDKIKAAAEALAAEKPHLARVRGDAGQGFRGDDSDAVDLAELLRAGT
jgi:hypothetical protein